MAIKVIGNNLRAHISTLLKTQAVFLNISIERMGLLEQVRQETNPSKHSQHRSTQVTFSSTISDNAIVSGSLKCENSVHFYLMISGTLVSP